jgi:hypothetical protein
MLISSGIALVACLGVFAAWAELSPMARIALPALGMAGLVSCWHVVATVLALMRPQLPVPMQVALMQPRWRYGMRWLVAIWWLMHLSFGAIIAMSVVFTDERLPWGAVIFMTLLSAAFTYAAHGFLMLMVTCFTKRSDWVLRAWGWRRISTIGHALAVLIAAAVR